MGGIPWETRCMENALLMSTDVGTHSESAELTVRRLRSLPAAPRTCARRGSHSFVFWPAMAWREPRGAAWPSENVSLCCVSPPGQKFAETLNFYIIIPQVQWTWGLHCLRKLLYKCLSGIPTTVQHKNIITSLQLNRRILITSCGVLIVLLLEMIFIRIRSEMTIFVRKQVFLDWLCDVRANYLQFKIQMQPPWNTYNKAK